MTALWADAAPERPALAGLAADTEVLGAGRFVDDVWDLTPLLRRRRRAERLYFTAVPVAFRQPVKEFAWLALRTPAAVRKARPHLDPETVVAEVRHLRRLASWLVERDVTTFAAVTQSLLDDYLSLRRQQLKASALRALVKAIQRLAAHSAAFSQAEHHFTVVPWRGRPATVIAGSRPSGENTTRRVPEEVMAPLLRCALLYVEQFSDDIIAARREAAGLARRADSRAVPRGEQTALAQAEIARRRSLGLGIPVRQDTGAADGRAVLRWAGVYPHRVHDAVQSLADTALAELGPAAGALTTAPSLLEATGAPWREPFPLGGVELDWEARRLGWACSLVIAYLSGMRPSELVNLRRDCAVVECGPDGTAVRYKLRGTAFKGRRPGGAPAVWVVLPIVHNAVEVLRDLHDGCDQALLLPGLCDTNQLRRFISYANRRFGHIPELAIPDIDGQPWALSFRQLRRTLAWHIRNRPFGHVAGAIQYQHAQITMFEGYAGTSASGFRQEVEAEREAANLAELFDLVVGALQGSALAGQGGERLARRVREIGTELGGLEGVVAHEERVKHMLKSEARTLHPALLNDCFFDSTTAKCLAGVPDDQRHSPIPNRCEPFSCPNAVIAAKHRPVWTNEHDTVVHLLATRTMPDQQRLALTTRKTQIERLLETPDTP